MRFTSEQRLQDGVLEREFTLGETPGTPWTPPPGPGPAPLILMAHNNGLPEIGGPVGYSGWAAVGIRPAVVEPRIAAAGLFAGGYVPRAQREEARQVTVPLLFLLRWDDEGNDRQQALDLFDAFGSEEKTLHANPGGHTGTPWFEVEDGDRFFGRHLRR